MCCIALAKRAIHDRFQGDLRSRFLLLVAIVTMGTPAAAAPLVEIGCPAEPPPGILTFESEITVDVGGRALGAYTFAVTFDPDVAVISSVRGGNAAEFSSPPITNPADFASGRTRLLAFNSSSLTSPVGLVSVAHVMFTALRPVASAVLDIEVITLADTDGERIQADTVGCGRTVTTVTPTELQAPTTTSTPFPSATASVIVSSPSATATVVFTATPSVVSSRTPVGTPSPTPSAIATPSVSPCSGDCDHDDTVSVSELIRGVAIALGRDQLAQCPSLDRTLDGVVAVDELLVAVNAALVGCGPPGEPSATETPSPAPGQSETPTSTATTSTIGAATSTPTRGSTPSQTPALNRPPELAHLAVYRAHPGYEIRLPIPATDPDGDVLQYAATGLPEGAELDESAGVLSWTPRLDQVGPSFIGLRCTDDGAPPRSAEGLLALGVSPVDACSTTTCEPSTGCEDTLRTIDESCCGGPAEPRLGEPLVGCPAGRALFIGRNNQGFGRLQNCDRLRVINFLQAGSAVRFNVEARCMSPERPVTLRARLETRTRVLFDREQTVTLEQIEDGSARKSAVVFPVSEPGPFFEFEGAEAQLSVTLEDEDGARVSRQLRLILTFDPLTNLAEVVDLAPPGR